MLDFQDIGCRSPGGDSLDISAPLLTRTFLLAGFIHYHSFLAEGLQVYSPQPGKICWLNVRIQEFPHIIQLHSVRAKTLWRRDTNNIQRMSFGFLDQFTPFCKWSDVSVPNHELAGGLPFTRDFQASQSNNTMRGPHLLPRCVTDAMGHCHEFFERTPLSNDWTLVTSEMTYARWFRLFLRISRQ